MSHTPEIWQRGHNPEDIVSGDTLVAKAYHGNAPLIIAAPDLLETLEAVADYLYNPFEPDNQSPMYHRVRAAITRARDPLNII